MIYFRQTSEPRDRLSSRYCTYWYVEFWDDDGRPWPVGTAYVRVNPPGLVPYDGPATLNYIFVLDEWRRRGVATALILACQERWPGIDLGGAASDAGEALLRKMERLRQAEAKPRAARGQTCPL